LYELSRNAGCDLFAIVSTPAVSKPSNLEVSSLRLAELHLQHEGPNTSVSRAIVRVPNLLDHPGSPVQLIQAQLDEGTKVRLNHPDEARYFLSASSAAALVLLAACSSLTGPKGGCALYAPALGDPVQIVDLARLIMKDYGLDPDAEAEIEFASSGAEGNWQDEISIDERCATRLADGTVWKVESPGPFSRSEVLEHIEEFRLLVEREDREGAVRRVDELLREAEERASTTSKTVLTGLTG
jgi:FlaA1/EpsC-like NDP-sugar epimerase